MARSAYATRTAIDTLDFDAYRDDFDDLDVALFDSLYRTIARDEITDGE